MTAIFNIFIVVIVIILVLNSGFINNTIKLVFIILLLILVVTVILIIILNDNKKKKKKQEKTEDVGTVIGIDLGTTYCRVGVYKNGRLETKTLFPSYVAFTNKGGKLVGDAAKDQLIVNPRNTIFNAYRLMGRQWTDEVVQNSIREFKFSFELVEQNGQVSIQVQTARGEERFAPELICAMLIGEMKEIAERYLGSRVSHAIITVPANFNNAQRLAIETAVKITGLRVLSLINASIAAAITYDLKKQKSYWTRFVNFSRSKIVLVFDLGGGHFDINLISIGEGDFEVLSTNGDTYLGGEDFDQRVVNHFIKIINEKTGRDVRQDGEALQKLRIKVEEAKKKLSESNQVNIEIKDFFENYDFVEILTRDTFEQLNENLFISIIESVNTTLAEIKMKKTRIDEVIFVGGSSRIPKIQQLVKDYFDGRRGPYLCSDDDVLFGTAFLANCFSGEEDTEFIDILNVAPFSIGVQDAGGWISEMISKNTPIPTVSSTCAETLEDGQTSVFIKIYEGEKGMANNNRFLGQFELTGITPAPPGQTEIMVTLTLNDNGVLQVSAKETATGNERTLDIAYDHNRRNQQEIDNIVRDYERYA